MQRCDYSVEDAIEHTRLGSGKRLSDFLRSKAGYWLNLMATGRFWGGK
jgi:hypothetical protein